MYIHMIYASLSEYVSNISIYMYRERERTHSSCLSMSRANKVSVQQGGSVRLLFWRSHEVRYLGDGPLEQTPQGKGRRVWKVEAEPVPHSSSLGYGELANK